jgi:hypothetical protein
MEETWRGRADREAAGLGEAEARSAGSGFGFNVDDVHIGL